MSDDDFKGERLTPTKVEVGLIAAIVVLVGAWVFIGVDALVVLGVLLAIALLVIVALLARGGHTPMNQG